MATLPLSNPLKIALVLDDGLDAPDGVQQYVLSIGAWLASQGHDVHFLVGQTRRTDLPNLHTVSKNVGVTFNGNKLSIPLPTSRRKLKHLLDYEQFDVIHVQLPFSPWMGGRIISLAPRHTVVMGTFHILPNSWWASAGSRLLALWTRRAWRRLDTVVSVSSAAVNFARDAYGISSTVLPNVIDYHRFANAESRYKSDKKTILFLGRLVPRKGCRYLLEAIAALDRDRVPPFRVVVCGKGPLLPELQDYVRQQGLDDVVEFAGFVSEEDKPSYYASADIAVFPSTGGESFGIVLIEAMASGAATVLGGDNPGYASVLEPQASLLFDPRNKERLVQLLTHYLTDDTSRRTMAQWGADYAASFDVEVIGPRLVSLYEQLLTEKNMR